AAGREILIEEFMEGEEISLFALCDGEAAVPLLAAQDHKRLLDGDNGPNTGGMGAYAPSSIATRALVARAMTEVIRPVLAALRDDGAPFTGLLYAGLMIFEGAPRVVEFNCRFGDPETQALLPLMKSSLLDLLSVVARGESIATAPAPEWLPLASVNTVLAASGYPETPRTGDRIHLPPPPPDVEVFHAGTSRADDGDLVTAGGRVLSVTATAPTLEEAAARSRAHAEQIVFSGRQLRRDIAWRELARHAGAS
ncbi:MAG TPA: phosphoribosylglycinamide synthetase C domain-containing protein, partial [Gemmatimonadaceae bacterium]|nr:phosphoribosylglycinamide synthetase C domain-containing protein [Gemmatimonadaceae bacterium]